MTRLERAALAAVLVVGCAVEYEIPATSAANGPCGDDEILCGDRCVDSEHDPNHCGGCGRACELDEACEEATCTSECGDEELLCDQQCVEIESDPDHCGGCDRPCPEGVTCHDGQCEDGCDGACDDATQVCVGEICACRSGLTDCDGSCVNLVNDPSHCGMCNRACDGIPCGASDCRPGGCDGFGIECNGSCADTQTDPLHCGDCDRTCDTDELCVLGECENVA